MQTVILAYKSIEVESIFKGIKYLYKLIVPRKKVKLWGAEVMISSFKRFTHKCNCSLISVKAESAYQKRYHKCFPKNSEEEFKIKIVTGGMKAGLFGVRSKQQHHYRTINLLGSQDQHKRIVLWSAFTCYWPCSSLSSHWCYLVHSYHRHSNVLYWISIFIYSQQNNDEGMQTRDKSNTGKILKPPVYWVSWWRKKRSYQFSQHQKYITAAFKTI